MPGMALEAGPDVTTVLWAAEQTVRMHVEQAEGRTTGVCKQCTPSGCPQLSWASRVLEYLGTPGTSGQHDQASPSPTSQPGH